MTENFVTTLEIQLTQAEERLERGTRVARLQARARTSLPSRPRALALAAAACAAFAIVVGAAALIRGHHAHRTVVRPAPHIVGRIPTGGALDMATGFGQMWVDSGGRLVRVDLATHRILARIPVGHLVTGVAVAGGSVWTVSDSTSGSATISRIDPGTNRVARRLRLTGADYGLVSSNGLTSLFSNGRDLWAVGYLGGVRIDPARMAVVARARWGFGSGFFVKRVALAGNDLWAYGANGRLLLLDAQTGARRAALGRPLEAWGLVALGGRQAVLAYHDGTVTRIDATGRQMWRAQLPGPEPGSDPDRGLEVLNGAVWALRENTSTNREQLVQIDLASGRLLRSISMPGIESDWLTQAAGNLWLSAGEQTVVVSP